MFPLRARKIKKLIPRPRFGKPEAAAATGYPTKSLGKGVSDSNCRN
jgi:hypothetical protein